MDEISLNPTDTAKAATPAESSTDTPTAMDANGTVSKAHKEIPSMKQLYEQSTQFNHWRYTQENLDGIRSRVNKEAESNIRANIAEERALVRERQRAKYSFRIQHLAGLCKMLTLFVYTILYCSERHRVWLLKIFRETTRSICGWTKNWLYLDSMSARLLQSSDTGNFPLMSS